MSALKKRYQLYISRSQVVQVRNLENGQMLTPWEIRKFLELENAKNWKEFFIDKKLVLIPSSNGFECLYISDL